MEQNDRSLATKMHGWTRRMLGLAPGAPAPLDESIPREPVTRRGHGVLSRRAARTEAKLDDFLFLLVVCVLIDPYLTMVR